MQEQQLRRYLASINRFGNGIEIISDSYTCVMCSEEYEAKPQRCARCDGTLFEFNPGTARKEEVPDRTMFNVPSRRGRPPKQHADTLE